MSCISIERLINARDYINENVNKPETFSGLIFFLLSVKNRELDGHYLEADMAKFCDFVDKAFYLKDIPQNYPTKSWYAFLSQDWKEQILDEYLRGEKILVNDLVISLFWYRKDELLSQLIEELKVGIGEEIFKYLFIETKEEDQYVIDIINRDVLYKQYKGADTNSNYTLKFNGDFIKYKASALSSATFGQTLYASLEIKKVMQVADFDFKEAYSLNNGTKKNNLLSFNNLRLYKPFLLLAGISGTGKTRFIREQAKSSGSLSETYCLISVRPDWHEPSDLLGYVSRLTGKAEYITSDVLIFIVKAWKAIIDAGVELKVSDVEGCGERLAVKGNISNLDKILPYWLCLDEMNLAPIEQYFADYLSVLETREWNWIGESFSYYTDPLLKPNVFNELEDTNSFRTKLGLDKAKYNGVWDGFCTYGLGIPFNLLVAGTVNMDETTHGFSRKVIDRALSFDFGDFFPNDFNAYFEPKTQNKTLYYPILSSSNLCNFPEIDPNGEKTISFLKEVNKVLDQTPFKLAYRALNELLLAVVAQNPQTKFELLAVWDDFLMCKVLPRIEGDSDKLANSLSSDSLLSQLNKSIRVEFVNLVEIEFLQVEELKRPDLYREFTNEENNYVECRSLKKISWMQLRLERSGFTSFWP